MSAPEAVERQEGEDTNMKTIQSTQYRPIEWADLRVKQRRAQRFAYRAACEQKGRDTSDEHAPQSQNGSAKTIHVA